MVTTREMAGPVPSDVKVGKDISRVWPERWSINRKGLETIIHVARRKDVDELDRLRRKLIDALALDPPY